MILEGALVSMDNQTGIISAAVGGRSFRSSQFNRLTEAKRQVGSLVKPFVYLAAIQKNSLTPDRMIENSKLLIEYEKQKWSPENYEKTYSEPVPAHVALKNSMNIPAARVTMEVGVKNLLDTLYQIGFQREIPAVPSISLGSFEQTPMTMLSNYSTLSRLGTKMKPTFVLAVTDNEQKEIYKFTPQGQLVFSQSEIAVLISMMKQTNLTGTAKFIGLSKFPVVSAGKTGTTNDYKDAWYIGFTPRLTTLVWVGYDQNQSHGLTGGSAAVPAWFDFMMEAQKHSPKTDWSWPADTELRKLTSPDTNTEVELLFKK